MENDTQTSSGKKPYIFISYSRRDSKQVLKVLEAMSNQGYHFWYDESIKWAESWRDEIASHIAECEVLIAFHSKASRDSEHCRAELQYALVKKKKILSVYLEKVDLAKGLALYMSPFQSVNLYDFPKPELFVDHLNKQGIFSVCRVQDVGESVAKKQAFPLNAQWRWRINASAPIIITAFISLLILFFFFVSSHFQFDAIPVLPSNEKPGHYEYRYGRWEDRYGSVNWCKEYGESITATIYVEKYTEWSTTRATADGTFWQCGHFDSEHPHHTHVDHYNSNGGYPLWARYILSGYENDSFYWEETRWVKD